jgi:hypothetical protein
LILNKKSISNYENQLFQSELEKFRPHQNRLLQANHKQSTLMKELSQTFNALLQDKRVRAEQSKYESIQRQRTAVINRYKRAYQEFLDLEAGLQSAKVWYAEMKETVESLEKNVETFVNNRRSEGAQLLNQIEQERAANKNSQAEMERERLRGLMERMSMDPAASPPAKSNRPIPAPLFQPGNAPRYPQTNFQGQYQVPNSPPPGQTNMPTSQSTYPSFNGPPSGTPYTPPINTTYSQPAYNPSQYGRNPGPTSPPPTQTSFGIAALRGQASPPPTQTTFGQQIYGGYPMAPSPAGPPAGTPSAISGFVPPGFVPPPPPPGPPPLGPQQTVHFASQQQQQQQQEYPYNNPQSAHPQSAHPNSAHPRSAQPQQNQNPWAGLDAWK